MQAESLLEGLTEPQQAAVRHTDGPLLVLAGPGSGKTRVITRRAAFLARTVARPEQILAITFTNKAAAEMAERMARLGVGRGLTCSTFHAFCARLLRTYADRAGLNPNFSIFDEADQAAAMRSAVQRAGLSTENYSPARMLEAVGRCKNDMILPEECARTATDFAGRAVAAIYEQYQAVLAAQNALDFDDLLVRAALLLGEDPRLRDALQERFRYVLVDEYQDTNHAQYLIARGLSLDHRNLCVTGDPDQSIYAWRGANIGNILRFEEDFPDARVIRLEQNYRSTPQILRAAGSVIRRNRGRKPLELWTSNADGPPVRVVQCESGEQEAAFVASEIRAHAEAGGTFGQVAVFYRTNSLSRQIETALQQARISYQVARGVAFFQRREIKDVLAYLKLIVNPADAVALTRIINVPARGIGDATVAALLKQAEAAGRPALELAASPEEIPGIRAAAAARLRAFAGLIAEARATARQGSVRDTVEHVVRHSGLIAGWGRDESGEELENVQELIHAAGAFDRRRAGEADPGDRSEPLVDWLQEISLVSDVDAVDPQRGAVTLMTLHAAKGLEFDLVFITGVEHGLLPHERSLQQPGDLEEERRLLFVGMTRARRALTLTWARWREQRGALRRTSRSVFLKELPGEEVAWLKVGEDDRTRYDTPAGEAEDRPSFRAWPAGAMVRHPEHGLGRLERVEPAGRQTRAVVRFMDGQMRSFVLEFSELQSVDPDEIGDLDNARWEP